MSDFCDDASATTELYLNVALAKRRTEGPPPKGFCYNCTEPIAAELRFCDIDCRDDWVILSAR